MRRVKRLNPTSVPDGQGELFPDYRHHGVLAGSQPTMLQAETDHPARTGATKDSSGKAGQTGGFLTPPGEHRIRPAP